ncbi:MAG: hypothetical protein LBS25_09305 [Candidatus Symbiothrix sp.]|jgi:hypothetical protein|nr:hypothetical protein [Candidatus Symbiothrix sp.]
MQNCGYPTYKTEKHQIGRYSTFHEAEATIKQLPFQENRHSFEIEEEEKALIELEAIEPVLPPSFEYRSYIKNQKTTYLPDGKLLCESLLEFIFNNGDIVEVLQYDGSVTIGIITGSDFSDYAENIVYFFTDDCKERYVWSSYLFPPRFPIPDEIKNHLRTKYMEKGNWNEVWLTACENSHKACCNFAVWKF